MEQACFLAFYCLRVKGIMEMAENGFTMRDYSEHGFGGEW